MINIQVELCSTVYFLENAGELRFIILRREQRARAQIMKQHLTETRNTFTPETPTHKTTSWARHTNYHGGGQSRKTALEPQP
jgi:hypothetical protein